MNEVIRAYAGICAGYLVLSAPAMPKEMVTVVVNDRNLAVVWAVLCGIAAYYLATIIIPKIRVTAIKEMSQ